MADRYDEEMFLGYVEGDLPPAQREQFEALMEEDPRLRNLVAQIVHDRNALRAIPQLDPPASLRERPVEQLERGMLLGPVEPKRAATPRRSRMYLPRLVTYAGLAAMLLLCVGLVINILTDQNIRNIGGPDPVPGPPIAAQPPTPETPADLPTNTRLHPVPVPHHDAPTVEPTISDPGDAAPTDPGNPAMVATTVDPTPTVANTQATDATTPLIANSMQSIEIETGQPIVILPQAPNSPMSYIFGQGLLERAASLPQNLDAMPQRLIVHSRDMSATVATIHAWAVQSNALIYRPSNDLLQKTGISIYTDGQEHELQVVTPEQFLQMHRPADGRMANLPDMARAGDSYVIILGIRPEQLPQIETHISAQKATAAMTRAPNTAVPAPVQAPAPARTPKAEPAADAGKSEQSLEMRVNSLVVERSQPAADKVVPPADAKPAVANATAAVNDGQSRIETPATTEFPDTPEATHTPDATQASEATQAPIADAKPNMRKLISVEIRPIAPPAAGHQPSKPAVTPVEAPKTVAPATIPASVVPATPSESPLAPQAPATTEPAADEPASEQAGINNMEAAPAEIPSEDATPTDE